MIDHKEDLLLNQEQSSLCKTEEFTQMIIGVWENIWMKLMSMAIQLESNQLIMFKFLIKIKEAACKDGRKWRLMLLYSNFSVLMCKKLIIKAVKVH
jgi:hypothetical protein